MDELLYLWNPADLKPLRNRLRNSADLPLIATHMKQVEAQQKWNPSDLPEWLDEDYYRREILPKLGRFTIKKIRTAIDVTHPYAAMIKKGIKVPHPRHWLALAKLADVLGEG